MFTPSLAEFREKAKQGNLIPVYREVLADMETPVSAFQKLSGLPHAFLLESVVGGERIGRYSIMGGAPWQVLKTRGNQVVIHREGETQERELRPGEDPLDLLRELLEEHQFVADPALPPFCGGAVGFLGYDAVRFFERLPDDNPDDLQLPECYFVFTDTLLIFDHVMHRVKALCNARVGEDVDAAYHEATAKVDRLLNRLHEPLRRQQRPPARQPVRQLKATSQERYEDSVRRAKEYIAAGDVIQVVVSQRVDVAIEAEPFEIYRALRSVNPSPYMFFLQFDDCQIIGASPEMLVQERDGIAVTRPIAGTIHRGRTAAEDEKLAAELLADPKERAEHVMLVDLHRNDIGRVCEYGSVEVDEMMVIEKYSHVMHIVSNVVGRMRPDKSGLDLLRAAFPAGTVTGAPKIRAMEIIEELEEMRRGPYGGTIGYFSYSGNMDTAIILRTIVTKGSTAYVQAGAGIVADSVPAKEYQECKNKAQALVRAIELAQAGLE